MADDKRPYRQDHHTMQGEAGASTDPPEPIPGELDPSTEVPVDSAIVWSMTPDRTPPAPEADLTINDATKQDRAWEGGGIKVKGQKEKGKG